jgi:hypothetical protein
MDEEVLNQDAEGAEVPENETPAERSKRELLLERMQGRYPDQAFDDDEALYGQALGDMDEYEGRLGKQDEVDRQLTELFESNPMFGSHFMDMLEGKNPLVSMIEKYGDDLRAALEDPDQAEELAKANESYVQRLGKEKELQESYEANIAKSIEEADALEQSGAYTPEQIDDAFKAILDDAAKAIQGEISAEMLEMRLKGVSYDEDIQGATEEATVKAKNEKIEAKKKDLKAELPMIDGGASKPAKKQSNPTLDSLDRMTGSRDMWADLKPKKY